MRRQIVLGIALSTILIFGMTAGALAQETKFSARVLAKGSQSNITILVKNSGKSTESIYEFTVTFTKGNPTSSTARGGWDDQKDGNTIKFTTKRNAIKPGGSAIFIVKASDPAGSAFEWTVKSKDGTTLQSDEVSKIKVREKKPASQPKVTTPEITLNQVRITQGGQIIVTGKGFSASISVQIYLDDQQQLTASNTNAAGEFTAVVIIPNTAAPGSHMITAKDPLGKSSLIQILVEGSPITTLPGCQPGQLILTVCVEKTEYKAGDTVKITGTAVLESPVSLQITDPQGGIICGANPHVNNATMTWEATCFLPNSAPNGKYVVQVKQIVHKSGTSFVIKAPIAGGGGGAPGTPGVPGEDPGPLKLSTDKPSYKTGDIVKITLEGARAKSIVRITILAPEGPPLESKQVTTDDKGAYIYNLQLVAAKPGTYKVSATQNVEGAQGKYFIVRTTFEVTA